MVAIGGESHGGEVLANVLGDKKWRSVCQDNVIFGEAFLGCWRRRNDDDETRTEPERKYFAIALGNSVKCVVEGLLELVDIS